ncbi:Serine/threonine-protein kinase SRPK [Grifola frondosa]|uniref:Serine/threonine-protein kinase SRPK n=1 Tax=Grifola frondosa TaxID=5627 RepID=A0A1C7M821_GRIFR|nr:Serine/threonine-protein kinase SRPK [Grifola frondosa]
MGVHIYKFMDCLLLKSRRYPEEVARMVIRDVLRALDYAHTECSIIHTDIKLSNVLAACYGRMTVDLAMASDEEEDLHSQDCIAADGSTVTIHETAPVLIMPQQPEDWNQMLFKLVDFGVDKVDQRLSQMICTIPARPPEVAIGAKWDTSVDIWEEWCLSEDSCGTTLHLFQMLSHCILYPEDVTEGILPIFQWRIFGDFPPELVARSSKGIAWFDENGHLLDGLVEALQNEGHLKLRISLKEYLEAVTDGEVTFSDECWDILEKMLTVDPQQRPTAKELLSHPWLSGELPKAYYFTG